MPACGTFETSTNVRYTAASGIIQTLADIAPGSSLTHNGSGPQCWPPKAEEASTGSNRSSKRYEDYRPWPSSIVPGDPLGGVSFTSMNTELFSGHLRSSDTIRYFLECNVARVVRRAMIRFFIDAERREAAVISRADTVPADITRSRDKLIAYFLG